jgi:hypothetical protein
MGRVFVADDKCTPDSKKSKDNKRKYYYKCKNVKCDEECVLTLTMDENEKITEALHCECKKLDWSKDPVSEDCKFADKEEKVPNTKLTKRYFKCLKGKCDKECVLFLTYKEGKDDTTDFDHIVDHGCECKDW